MSTKKEILADPLSVFNRSADDEPLFVIAARDPVAVEAVMGWIECATTFAAHSDEKRASADKVAREIERYQLKRRESVRRDALAAAERELRTTPFNRMPRERIKTLMKYLGEEIKDRQALEAEGFELTQELDPPNGG